MNRWEGRRTEVGDGLAHGLWRCMTRIVLKRGGRRIRGVAERVSCPLTRNPRIRSSCIHNHQKTSPPLPQWLLPPTAPSLILLAALFRVLNHSILPSPLHPLAYASCPFSDRFNSLRGAFLPQPRAYPENIFVPPPWVHKLSLVRRPSTLLLCIRPVVPGRSDPYRLASSLITARRNRLLLLEPSIFTNTPSTPFFADPGLPSLSASPSLSDLPRFVLAV